MGVLCTENCRREGGCQQFTKDVLQRGGAEIELTIRRLYVSNNVTISLAFEWSLWEERKERKGILSRGEYREKISRFTQSMIKKIEELRLDGPQTLGTWISLIRA